MSRSPGAGDGRTAGACEATGGVVGGAWGCRPFAPRPAGGSFHVGPGDPPAGTGPGDLGRVEAVLVDEAPDEWREQRRRCRRGGGRFRSDPGGCLASRWRRRGRFRRRGLRRGVRRRRCRSWCGRRRRRRFGLFGGSSLRGGGSPGVGHHGEDGPYVDGLAFGDTDLGEHPRCGRRHFGVDLVGRYLVQRLVDLDRVANCLEPLRDGALGDGLAELGKGYVCHARMRSCATVGGMGGLSCAGLGRSGRARSRRSSPTGSDAAG